MKRLIAMLALSFAASAPSRADTEPPVPERRTEPVVVTATRTPEKLSETIQPVRLILEPDIEAAQQSTLTELLQARAGVEIAATGGYGQPSSVFIRGANSNHTLVLLDGIRINSALGGTAPFEDVRTTHLSRIEVVPGPLSSLYGPEAIGGVVQLFTHRWPEASRLRVGAGLGSYDTRGINGSLSSPPGNTGLALSADYFESDGFSATKPNVPFGVFDPDDDGYRNASGSLHFAHRPAAGHELGVNGLRSESKTFFDNGLGVPASNERDLGVYSAYTRNQLTERWQSVLRVGTSIDEQTLESPNRSDLSSEQVQVTWQNDIALPIGTLIAGAEYLGQSVDGTTPFTVDERDIYALFGGYVARLGRHTLQASVRHDDNSQFGGQTTGALGYAFQFTEAFRGRASAGTAFRAPTFFDLYDPFFGNPELNPEEGRSWEAGIDYTLRAGRFSATYFENRISELVVFDSTSFQPKNLNRARIRGGEFTYYASFSGLEVQASLTLQEPISEDTGKRLPRRSEVFGSLALAHTAGRLKLAGEVVGSGERFDSTDENPATRLAPYAILNLVSIYTIAPGWQLDVRWNNVFDEDYELALGYNTPGSNVFVALKYER
jgi:vitamin B12 transporter